MTVPVALLPPWTDDGSITMLVTTSGTRVSCADLVTPPYVPKILTVDWFRTGEVVNVNCPVVWPAAIFTFAFGIVTRELSADIVTVAPPLGAGALRVTV